MSSQSTAASAVLSNASVSVVGLGGFSGSESDTSVAWLAQLVASGQVHYVMVDNSGRAGMRDGRIGASTVLAAAKKVGKKTTVGGLYDLKGTAAALRALA